MAIQIRHNSSVIPDGSRFRLANHWEKREVFLAR